MCVKLTNYLMSQIFIIGLCMVAVSLFCKRALLLVQLLFIKRDPFAQLFAFTR